VAAVTCGSILGHSRHGAARGLVTLVPEIVAYSFRGLPRPLSFSAGVDLTDLIGPETPLILPIRDAARAARGKRVRLEEREDGSLCFWNGGHALRATAFPKEHGVQAAEVVESKRLAETMEFIKQRQRERTEAKLAKPFTTLRKARLLRAGTPRRTETGSSPEPQP